MVFSKKLFNFTMIVNNIDFNENEIMFILAT